MAGARTPLYVRLPRDQAAALDRLAQATGRPKQHLVSEFVGDRLTSAARQLSVGRVEVTSRGDAPADEVLTLEQVAELLKLSADDVRAEADHGELPGRRFGTEWRFSRTAVLDWLADGDVPGRKRRSQTQT